MTDPDSMRMVDIVGSRAGRSPSDLWPYKVTRVSPRYCTHHTIRAHTWSAHYICNTCGKTASKQELLERVAF